MSPDHTAPDAPPDQGSDARLAAQLFALDPQGLGGIRLRARCGPAREAWLRSLDAALLAHRAGHPRARMPAHIDEDRLLGGLDLGATLATGQPVLQNGLLARTDQGVLTVPMAERLPARLATLLAQALDRGAVCVERDGFSRLAPARLGLVLLDESTEDEEPPAKLTALGDRLAFDLRLDEGLQRPLSFGGGARRAASAALPHPAAGAATVEPDAVSADEALEPLALAAEALGIASPRAVLLALRAARAHAALAGRPRTEPVDLEVAARLVLGPRATRCPPSTQDDRAPEETPPPEAARDTPPPPESPPPDGEPSEALPERDPADLADRAIAAATANLPAGLLAQLLMARLGPPGRSAPSAGSRAGLRQRLGTHGRPQGDRRGTPGSGARLSLLGTLRQAAPWQRLRASERAPAEVAAGNTHRPPNRLDIRRDDLRVWKHQPRSSSTTVFVVDASGSSALHRLAEAKGAVELLLADCYVRRDRVAVIGFRRTGAELLLPPTRSLVRAKRSLAGLPGGGGTPVATALDVAHDLARTLTRSGDAVTLVLLTDGRANVARDGSGGRQRAHADALAAARQWAGLGVPSLLIDTSPQPQALARELATGMGGRYVPLPQARAHELSAVVKQARAAG